MYDRLYGETEFNISVFNNSLMMSTTYIKWIFFMMKSCFILCDNGNEMVKPGKLTTGIHGKI